MLMVVIECYVTNNAVYAKVVCVHNSLTELLLIIEI